MSGVAHSIPDPLEPDMPELDWKCRLCGAEEEPLMLGPWRDRDGRYLTVTRCRDWHACAERMKGADHDL